MKHSRRMDMLMQREGSHMSDFQMYTMVHLFLLTFVFVYCFYIMDTEPSDVERCVEICTEL